MEELLDAQEEIAKDRRRARNREHARNSRAKKQKKLSHVDQLEAENAALRQAVDLLQKRDYSFQKQIALLRGDVEFVYVPPPSDIQGLFLEPVTDAELQYV